MGGAVSNNANSETLKQADALVAAKLAEAGAGVTIFSKSFEGESMRTRAAVEHLGIAPVILEIDSLPSKEARAVLAVLHRRTKRHGVPSVWLGGKFVSGTFRATKTAIEKGVFDIEKGVRASAAGAGQRTVPSAWSAGEHGGGDDDTLKPLEDGAFANTSPTGVVAFNGERDEDDDEGGRGGGGNEDAPGGNTG